MEKWSKKKEVKSSNSEPGSFIDTHCHLDMSQFDGDRDEVLRRATESGVKYIINVGSDIDGCRTSVGLSRIYEDIYATVGIHPHDADSYSDDIEGQLKGWAGEDKVVAVGEIGLDYHYDNSPRDVQRRVFARQLQLSVEINLPVVIHSRDAEEDTLGILGESGVTRGVMHCFSGDREMAEQAMAKGFFISVAGPVTFRNAGKLQEVVSQIPDEYLLIETDAPYLSPEPYRGKRNEPSFIIETARKIAQLRGISLDDIKRITTLNAMRLFGIGEIPPRGETAYRIRNSLYLNVTNRCTNACTFCVRFHSDYVKGYNLRLNHEPGLEEMKDAIGDPSQYKEVVFCGYGEPLIRLELIKSLARWVKEHGGRVRINTNGHGNLIHGRNILPELSGIVDSLSISLDAHDEDSYNRICMPLVKNAYQGILDFIREAKEVIPDVTVTVVDVEGVDVERCRRIARELGVKFRLRRYNVVG